MASMLLDYLATDVFVRSKGKISFPAEYIEGYAYLQSKMYGVRKGTFNEEKDVQLWMPSQLLQIDNTELNYIAGRTNNKLLLALTNQSNRAVTAKVTINKELVNVQKNTFSITVPANGINTIVIPDTPVPNTFQQKILAVMNDKSKDYAKLETGHAHAMLFKLGSYGKRLYIYLEDDDTKWSKVSLHYNNTTVNDTAYPFEFTVPVKEAVTFSLSLYDREGQLQKSEKVTLGNK
jgi:hypothetical protein